MMDRVGVIRLVRDQLSECDERVYYYERRSVLVTQVTGMCPESYALSLVRAQFYVAQEAAWRDFGRRLRDLLAEMGESP